MPRNIFSYSRAQQLVGALLRNRNIQRFRVPRFAFANVGCGYNTYPGFVNIDYGWHKDIHLCWDITKGLPLDDSSIEGIFTEHCLEHISYDQGVAVLGEMFRILKPEGVLRIIVPDGGLYIDLYQRHYSGEDIVFPYVDFQGQKDFLEDSRFGFTPMMAVNRMFRGYGHVFAYDFETMRNLVAHVGFKTVNRCSFRKGKLPKLLIDSQLRAPQSLFIEAIK